MFKNDLKYIINRWYDDEGRQYVSNFVCILVTAPMHWLLSSNTRGNRIPYPETRKGHQEFLNNAGIWKKTKVGYRHNTDIHRICIVRKRVGLV